MTLSRTEITKRSDDKRGIKLKAFKLPLAMIEKIEQLSAQHNIPQNQLIIQAISAFEEKHQ